MVMQRGIRDEGMKRLAKQVKFETPKQAQDLEEGYQGWKNYETWAVALMLDNERSEYEYWQERIAEIKAEYGGGAEYEEQDTWAPDAKIKFTLSDELKNHHEEAMPELDGVWGQLLSGALQAVYWDEIAEHLLTE